MALGIHTFLWAVGAMVERLQSIALKMKPINPPVMNKVYRPH
jgi:hypothetical protein